MDGFFSNHRLKTVMFGQDFKRLSFLSLLFLFSCINETDNTSDFFHRSVAVVGKKEYDKVFQLLNDTMMSWHKHQVFNIEKSNKNKIDSLICFNRSGDRFITCLLVPCFEADCKHDEVKYLLGEKINTSWYILKVNVTFSVPRSTVKNHNISIPLSYDQLHQVALKEVYANYLLPNREINDAWFTTQFEGPGWYKWDETPEQIKKLTRKDFEQRHLEYVKRMWEGRDTSSIVP